MSKHNELRSRKNKLSGKYIRQKSRTERNKARLKAKRERIRNCWKNDSEYQAKKRAHKALFIPINFPVKGGENG